MPAILKAFNLRLICSVIFTCYHSELSLQGFFVPNKNPSTRYLELSRCLFALKRVSDALVCLLCAAGLRPGPDGGSGLVQEVHALRQREGPDAGLGPVLPRVPAHLQAAAAGGRSQQRHPHHT